MGRAGDIVARAALEAEPPFTIGVTGKWGCGKTSVMRRAFATLGGRSISQNLRLGADKLELDREEQTKLCFKDSSRTTALPWDGQIIEAAKQSLSIWYSPWQHQGAENPLIPLLQELRAQYCEKRKSLETKNKVLNRNSGLAALALLEHIIDAAISLNIGKPVKIFSGVTENTRKVWNENNPENLVKPSDGQRFHLLFEDAVENLLQDLHNATPTKFRTSKFDNTARLIIFIDDLDRCEEKAVVTLLEAIKLYLGTRRCVFVLGVDEVAVGDALKRHWHGRSDDSNREYLEKLFQAMIPVPQPEEKSLQALIIEQLQSHDFPQNSIAKLAQDITQLLEPNPRKIKNFLNSLCANWQILRNEAMQNPEHCQRLVMFQYLRHNHRPVWRLLEREPNLLPLLQRVIVQQSLEPIPGYTGEEHRLAREIFTRSFAHVLPHVAENGDTKTTKHNSQDLDQAVERALESLDRRRSDQHFMSWARDFLSPVEPLHPMYLRINSENNT